MSTPKWYYNMYEKFYSSHLRDLHLSRIGVIMIRDDFMLLSIFSLLV
jgi:hypothetical protein